MNDQSAQRKDEEYDSEEERGREGERERVIRRIWNK
jgi:hypothetical protein